ncbi:MAG: BatA domain-containing protein [Planctomycetia bacterium]|nr:BatA domain-containing protein [Planctomycetia bacterium]
MTFLSPAWMTTAFMGLAALSIPIIIHYLFRSRYRVVPWAAMEFLKKSLEEATRRIRFRELILLLMRMALLGMLAFALMRPSSLRQRGDANSPVDAVFIMDVSSSMAIQDGQQTRLEDARKAALALLETLPAQSTLHILQTGRNVVDLGPRSPVNRDQARIILSQLSQNHETAPLIPALRQASEILTRGSLANKEVYLFSDMQRSNWTQSGSELAHVWSSLQQMGQVILVQTHHETQPANASISNLRAQVALPLPGDRVPFLVEVRNTGSRTLEGLTITLQGSDAEKDVDVQPVPTLKPGEMIPMTLTTRLEQRGRNIVTATLQGDELTIDNKLETVIETRDRLKVLIIDGRVHPNDPAQSSSYFLAHALGSLRSQNMGESGLNLEVVSAIDVYPAQLADVQVCFLTGMGTGTGSKLTAEMAERLGRFVREGGGLILFAGGSVSDMGLESLSSLLPARWGSIVTASDPLKLDMTTIPAGSFLSPFRYPPLDRLGQADIFRLRSLVDLQSDGMVLLKTRQDQPVLTMRSQGSGTVIMVGIDADLQSNDAVLRPGYLPWIQSMIGQVLNQQAGRKNLVAGETLVFTPDAQLQQKKMSLMIPGSQQLIPFQQSESSQSSPRLVSQDIHQAGLYRMVLEGTQAEETSTDTGLVDMFAVVPDAAETASLSTMSEEELSSLFAEKPVILQTKSLQGTGPDRSRLLQEWTPSLWWWLFAWCLLELAFGWYCNREV